VATDINGSGTVVGRCQVAGTWHGFSYDDGGDVQTFDVDIPGATGTEAWGINERGDIVGFYTVATDSLYHGFVRHSSSGVFEKIERGGAFNTMPEDINDAGYVVGCVHNNGLMTGFVWKAGQFLSISPLNSMFTGINESGTSIGYDFVPPPVIHSFIVSGVDRVEFEYTGSTNTQAWGLNQAGDVVGYFAAGGAKGFVRSHDGTFSAFALQGAGATRPLGINDAGTIVGAYVAGGVTRGFVLAK
jgi:uncharacterized membrane protein